MYLQKIDPPKDYQIYLRRQGFELEKVIGQGLSGSVFVAEQPSLGRKVAVKFFDSAFVRDDADMRKRFSREARILAKFQHQGIPYILTQGVIQATHGEAPYFIMEFIEGRTLRDILEVEKQLELQTAILYARQILDALQYAHTRNIIHRDVKPGNIMIDERGRCFLIDFSIGVSLKHETGLTRATNSSDQLGTTAYMAPEQFKDSSKVDNKTDIYSMGVVLFEMLTGHNDRTNIAKALRAYPHSITSCIETACASKPEDRFQSSADFVRALGGTQQILAPSSQPGLAICSNVKCSEADWTPNGYYRGPKKIKDSNDSYCTSCGERLMYRCDACGAPVGEALHCGNCGKQFYSVPTCKKCQSWLTVEYMNVDTTNGCSKCSGIKHPADSNAISNYDDEIPF